MSDDDNPSVPVELSSYGDDVLRDDPRVVSLFGDTYDRVRGFADLLAAEGVLRGLIGPRELSRLWERHILNSAAIAPFLKQGTLVDVGSGAGLPGMVIAAMEPQRQVIAVEPMERRVAWLNEAAEILGFENVTVVRGRAEEVRDQAAGDVVTARAVAAIDKLVKWCAPLVNETGEMVFLKGRSAEAEIDKAKYVLRKAGFVASVADAPTISDLDATRVVRLSRS